MTSFKYVGQLVTEPSGVSVLIVSDTRASESDGDARSGIFLALFL